MQVTDLSKFGLVGKEGAIQEAIDHKLVSIYFVSYYPFIAMGETSIAEFS